LVLFSFFLYFILPMASQVGYSMGWQWFGDQPNSKETFFYSNESGFFILEWAGFTSPQTYLETQNAQRVHRIFPD